MSGYGSNFGTDKSTARSNVDKILFKFNYADTDSDQDKLFRAQGSFKNTQDFERSLSMAASGSFTSMAGCDISAIFYPYRLGSGLVASMPTSEIKSYNHTLFPYHIDPNLDGNIINKLKSPSGDYMGSVVSSDYDNMSSDFLRDPNDVRSVGFRLPAVGVGWGKTTEGLVAPSEPGGQPSGLYKGGSTKGVDVDPKDYIAAPIDFRYDETRGVWTCARSESTFARITKCVAASGYYEAEQVVFWPEIQQWQTAVGNQNIYPSGWSEEPGNPNGVMWEIGKFSVRPTGTIIEASRDLSASGTFWWFENDNNEFWAEIISSWAEEDINGYTNGSGIITKGTSLRDNKWNYVTFPPASLSDQYRDEMFGTYKLRRVESIGSGIYSVPDPQPPSGCSEYLEFEAKNIEEIEFPNIWSDSNPNQQADSAQFGISYWIPSSGQYVRVKKIKRSNDPNENRDYDYIFNYPININDNIRTDDTISVITKHFGYEDKDSSVVIGNSFSHLFSENGSQFPMRSIAHKKKLYTEPGNTSNGWQVSDNPNGDEGVGWLDTSNQNVTVHPNSGSYGEITLRSVLYDPQTSGLKIYRLKWDDRGHLDTILDDNTTASGNFTDELVSVEDGKVPGFLNDVLDTPGDWLGKNINGNTLEITHEDAQNKDANKDLDFSVVEAVGTVTWTYYDTIEFDDKGHNRGTEVQKTFDLNILPASDPWLEIIGIVGGASLSHIGPHLEDHTNAPLQDLTSNDGTITFTYNILSFDEKGHHRDSGSATDTALMNVGSSDSSIDVSLTDEGGKEISIDLSVSPSGINGIKVVEVVTDVRVDTSTLKLQKKTIDITVLASGVESGWTDVHTGEECS